MKVIVGAVSALLWLLYIGQLIATVSFPLAQRLRLQEGPDSADPLLRSLELRTARWDVLWMWTLPIAGTLMLVDHSWWPYLALIGGGAFVDAGGREAAKWLGLRRHGVRSGTEQEFRLAMGVFMLLMAVGMVAIALAVVEVT